MVTDEPTPLRILFTFAGGRGHLNPMLPLADALREAGHLVALAGQGSVVQNAEGFARRFPAEPTADESESASTGVLVQPDLAHEFAVIGSYFVSQLGRATASRVGEVIQRWRPQVVVSDEMDFGAMVAAERAGLPRVIVKVIASGGLTRRGDVEAPLRKLRRELGLDETAAMAGLERDLVIAPFPRSFRDPAFALPPGSLSVRPAEPVPPEAGREPDPAVDWLREGAEATRIYVTLGTIFNTESGDLFQRILRGLSGLPSRVLATVGSNVDPGSLGIAAPNIRIERYVPQRLVLPEVDLVVNHAGSGSVIGALSHGVPVVAIPLGADQQLNADRIADLGVGLVLDPVTATPDDIRAGVVEALHSRRLQERALTLQREIGSLPPVASAVPRIEQLVRVDGRIGPRNRPAVSSAD
ncbi:N-glycosyltransferase [Frondihabitans sucicola]|uniref:N-glycosyltransferase n=1 Tax=Frondihabitans sucicola TaxID=1268041 RepID=A0ABM8GJA7_9MICO|nr:glycosyltransferase [Frondihabitans sucicola]BDZ48479.1 N-glycosyltransferase [Frondihabitans sucicola]